MGSIPVALAAGNAVVFKPSEYTRRSGLAADSFGASCRSSRVQLFTGTGRPVRRWAGPGGKSRSPDRATGRKVMAAALKRLNPGA